MADHYLLLETGSKILLETGSGILLDPTVTLGDLTFLPSFPDKVPHVRTKREMMWATSAATTSPKTIPIPDILATKGWLPCYPDHVPHRRPQLAPHRFDVAALAATAIAPLGWLPSYPHRMPRRARLHAAARQPAWEGSTVFDVLVGQSITWMPTAPPTMPRRHGRPYGSAVTYRQPPVAIASAIPCVELQDQTVTATTLTPDAVGSSALISEGLAATGLVGETLC